MSERERWVIYPLLFLALGAALRDKLFDRTTTKSIVCQELTIVDEEPIGREPVRVLAKIGRVESTSGSPVFGYLVLNGQLDVNGVVNAQQYAYKGVPFVPAIQAAFPSLSPADIFRLLQQSAPAWQNSGSPGAASGKTNEPAQSPPSAAPGDGNAPSEARPAAPQ